MVKDNRITNCVLIFNEILEVQCEITAMNQGILQELDLKFSEHFPQRIILFITSTSLP